MPGKDDRAGAPGARPGAGNGQARGGSAKDLSREKDGGVGAGRPLSGSGRDGERGITGAHNDDRDGRTALGKQTVGGVFDPHDAGTSGHPFQPPAILRAPSSFLSHPLFLHPVPQLSGPFRAPARPPPLPAPILFAPSAGAPEPPVPVVSAVAPSQTPDVPQPTQPPADVPSPKAELSVTSSAIDTAPTSVESPTSAVIPSAAASSVPSPESAIASTTSDSALDISPLTFAPAASLVDSSFGANPDILPVNNSGVGAGGKVAAACVIGAVLLLLVNWAFWLLIRRRRRARRSLPAHWDFAAPPPAKGEAGRDSEDVFVHSEPDEPVKGGMVTVPV